VKLEYTFAVARLAKEKYLVLMVDDSEDDCLLIKMAVSKAQRLSFIGSVSDGEEVVSYLNGEGKYADREKFPVPDMLLLDLMMPRKNGFEVLEWLRQQPFDDMVVVVLSGSDQVQDVKKAIALGADHYHTKEGSTEKRMDLIRALEEYLGRSNPKKSS
jgi:CheY-like chemotaxis protein